jgi:hypothetical protein
LWLPSSAPGTSSTSRTIWALLSYAKATLDEVSAPRPATYPYGAFGTGQRARELDGGDALADLVSEGSDAPLGRA